MGVRLIVEVLDSAPASLTTAERLVLVVLAEQARDTTRVALPGEDVLLHRSGLSDAASLRRAIRGLCEKGAVERVAVATDRNGNPVYACRGRRATYRILRPQRKACVSDLLPDVPPEAESRTTGPALKAGATVPLSPTERGTKSTRKGDLSARKGGPQNTPSPQYPSDIPQISARDRNTVAAALKRRTGKTITDEHADAVAAQILEAAGGPIRNREKYLRGAIDQDRHPERFTHTPGPPPYVRQA